MFPKAFLSRMFKVAFPSASSLHTVWICDGTALSCYVQTHMLTLWFTCLCAAHAGGAKMMATMLESGEMELTDEECEKLKLPFNSVIPVDSVPEIQGNLKDIADEEIRKLARQIGVAPEVEPYPGYFEDVSRLGLDDARMGTTSLNPASMYGPDGKAYAPWMVGKVLENAPKRKRKEQSKDDVEFMYAGRGSELNGAAGGGLNARLLGDEVRLTFQVGEEKDSKGYRIVKRRGGSEVCYCVQMCVSIGLYVVCLRADVLFHPPVRIHI